MIDANGEGGRRTPSQSAADEMLARLERWGRSEERVRALILVGSRGRGVGVDEFSDADVRVFAHDCEPYLRADDWLARIAPVWVVLPEKYTEGGAVIPTRLVIFAGGHKVDFAFHPPALLPRVNWQGGYRVLLDKDDLAAQLPDPPPPAAPHATPTAREFTALVEEFWFEAYHVAKYLARGELWLAKARDWTTKELLLRLIEWHAGARRGPIYETYSGKQLQAWVEPGVWQELHAAFASFARRNSWAALLASMNLFRRLAQETAARAGFAYPTDVDRHISGFILQLERRQD